MIPAGLPLMPQALEMVYADAMAGAGSSTRAALVSIPGNVLRLPLALLACPVRGKQRKRLKLPRRAKR